jgi:hypothetical protein
MAIRATTVDPVDWIERIPIAETRDYVQRIIENMQVYRARFGHASAPINEAELARRSGGTIGGLHGRAISAESGDVARDRPGLPHSGRAD